MQERREDGCVFLPGDEQKPGSQSCRDVIICDFSLSLLANLLSSAARPRISANSRWLKKAGKMRGLPDMPLCLIEARGKSEKRLLRGEKSEEKNEE
jgi:hypothetical protein